MSNARIIWNGLKNKGLNDFAIAGIMGNLYAESGLRPNNLQNSCQKSLGHTDESYTECVDNGTYFNFTNDCAGYGLAQWTYWSRKQSLLSHARAKGVSIGNLEMQIDFLWGELQEYRVIADLLNATSVRSASDAFMLQYERPKDQSEAAREKRANYGQEYYNKYAEQPKEIEAPTNTANGTVIEKAVAWALEIAKNDNHGYDQVNRWGKDYDCSSLVISAYEQAGAPVKTNGATYTGNMKKMFLKSGFADVTQSITLQSGAGLQYGDVLLKENSHTAIFIGNNQLVHASINEKGTVKGGAVGDQTGKEICTRSYYNKPWDYVLRYAGEQPQAAAGAATKTMEEIAKEVLAGKWGNGLERKKKLEAAGYSYKEVQTAVNQLAKGNSATAGNTHKVKKGDTLTAIARKYDTTVKAILAANKKKYPKITASHIEVGWDLEV